MKNLEGKKRRISYLVLFFLQFFSDFFWLSVPTSVILGHFFKDNSCKFFNVNDIISIPESKKNKKKRRK